MIFIDWLLAIINRFGSKILFIFNYSFQRRFLFINYLLWWGSLHPIFLIFLNSFFFNYFIIYLLVINRICIFISFCKIIKLFLKNFILIFIILILNFNICWFLIFIFEKFVFIGTRCILSNQYLLVINWILILKRKKFIIIIFLCKLLSCSFFGKIMQKTYFLNIILILIVKNISLWRTRTTIIDRGRLQAWLSDIIRWYVSLLSFFCLLYLLSRTVIFIQLFLVVLINCLLYFLLLIRDRFIYFFILII